MAIKSIRQAARKTAADKVALMRKARADLVKRREGSAAAVMTALAERDAFVAESELRAAAGLQDLVASGLPLAEACSWCDLPEKDAQRLLKAADVDSAKAS